MVTEGRDDIASVSLDFVDDSALKNLAHRNDFLLENVVFVNVIEILETFNEVFSRHVVPDYLTPSVVAVVHLSLLLNRGS